MRCGGECRLKQGVVLPDALHGFKAGRGTGTATMDANMDQQLFGITHNPLFQVFVGIRKLYDSLYRR